MSTFLAVGLAAGCSSDAAAPTGPEEQIDLALMADARVVAPSAANGIRLVYLSGTPYQMGYQHGVLLRQEITEMVSAATNDAVWGTFQALVAELGPDDGRTYLEHALDNSLPSVLDECRGLVDGTASAITLEQCIILSDPTYFIEDLVPRYLPGIDSVLGCSSFVATAGATLGGRMLHGRNLDYISLGPMRQYTTIFVRQPDAGARHFSFAWPGQVSVLTGMNEHGLAIGVHENSCIEAHRDMSGVPALHQATEILTRAADVDQALSLVRGTEQATCQMFVLSHAASSSAVVAEITADGLAVRDLGASEHGDVVFATNHFVAPDLLASQRELDLEDSSETSVARYTRLRERLTGASAPPFADLGPDDPDFAYGRIDVETAIDILRDPIDMRPDQNRRAFPCDEVEGIWAIGNNHNIHSAIMLGDRLELWLAAGMDPECGNALYDPYVGLDLREVLAGRPEDALLGTLDPPFNPSFGSGVHEDPVDE